MPYVIAPGTQLPPPPTTNTSSDGTITATLDAAHSGVSLYINVNEAASPNILPDPSFESGTGRFAPRMDTDSVERDSSRKHSGIYSLKVTPGDATNSYEARFSFDAVAGRTYTFSIWQYVPSGTDRNRNIAMGQGIFSEIHYNTDAVVFDDWQQVTVTNVAATSGTGYVHIYGGDTGGQSVWFDDGRLTDGLAPSDIVGFNVYSENRGLIYSGAPATAVGGEAVAYDHFMPVGETSAWYAEAIRADGSVIYTTDIAALFVPAQTNTTEVWIKSVGNPTLSMKLKAVNDMPSLSYGARQSFSQVLGKSNTVGSYDVWDSPTTEWTLYIKTVEERTQLVNLLQSGPLFIQPHPDIDVDDFYALPGDFSREYAGSSFQKDQLVTVSFTEIDQPAVEDTPLMTPGNSWQFVKDYYATWDTVKTSFDSWKSVTGIE